MAGVVVFIATGWGPIHGGINTFNQELCTALVRCTSHTVACVVPNASLSEINSASNAGVILILLGNSESELTDRHADLVCQEVRRHGFLSVDWWIGHDVITGDVSLAAKNLTPKSRCSIFHHMNYAGYKVYQGTAIDANKKDSHQRNVLGQADFVFAVGPKLLTSALDKTKKRDQVVEVIPGLQFLEESNAPRLFKAICFGRLSPREDLVKQGSLALLSFAAAIRDSEDGTFEDPLFSLIGISKANELDQVFLTRLRETACRKAGRQFPIHDLPYESDRNELLSKLREQSVALMLSLHEGFGLTAWEAISLAVPVIISKNSGVSQLIHREFDSSHAKLLRVVDIKGAIDGDEPNESDVLCVAKHILEVARDPKRAKADAIGLRDLLRAKGYTWEQAAGVLVEKLNLASLIHQEKATRCTFYIVDQGLDDCSELAIACCLVVYDKVQLLTKLNRLKDDISHDPTESSQVIDRITRAGFNYDLDHPVLRRRMADCIATLNCDAYLCVAKRGKSFTHNRTLRQHLLEDVLVARLKKHWPTIEGVIFEKQRSSDNRRHIIEQECKKVTRDSRSDCSPQLRVEKGGLLEVAAYIATITKERFARAQDDLTSASEFDLMRARVRLLHDADTGARFSRKNPLP